MRDSRETKDVARESKAEMRREGAPWRRAARVGVAWLVAVALCFQLPLGTVSTAVADDGAATTPGAIAAVSTDKGARELIAKVKSELGGSATVSAQELGAGTDKIDAAGAYRLSSDVERSAALEVSVPAGEVVVIDLNGHDLKVSGNASSAIDASGSLGTLVIVDSATWRDDDAAPSSVALESNVSKEAASIAALRFEVSDEQAEKLDGGQQAAIVACGVEFDATRAQGAAVSQTVGMRIAGAHAYLGANVAFGDRGSEADLDLSGRDADSFTFLEGFTAKRALAISCDDESAGTVFAHAAGAMDDADIEKILFVIPGSADVVCACDGKRSFVFSRATTTGSGSASSGGDAGSAASSENAVSSASKSARMLSTSVSNGRIDLNAAWEKAGLGSSYTITSAGTYYLSADLTTTARLFVDVDAGAVELDFEGHTLTSSSSNGAAISITSASKVTLEGDDARASKVVLTGSKLTNAVSSSADALVIEGLSVSCAFSSAYLTQTDLEACAVRVSSGTLELSNTALSVDLGNQGNAETLSNNAVKNGPTALVLGDNAGAATVRSSSLSVVNSKVVGVQDSSDVTSVGFAKGIYSTSSSRLDLESTSISASSALGTAIGVCAKNAEVTGTDQTSVSLEAGELAIGFDSLASSGVTLAAPVSVSATGDTYEYLAALSSRVSSGFVFGSGFSAVSGLSAWVGSSETTANDDGAVLGTFSDALDGSARAAVVSQLSNALGSDAACSIVQDGDSARFSLVAERAEAAIVDGGTVTPYARLSTAASALKDGQTLRLLKDADALSLSKSSSSARYTVDLCGHVLGGLTLAGSCSYTVVSSVAGGKIESGGTAAQAVLVSASGAVSLEGIEVDALASSQQVAAILSSGRAAVSLKDVTVSAASSRSSAYGVRLSSTSGGNLQIEGGSVSSVALVAGVAACGVVSSSTSNTVSISDCPVTVTGTNSTARGIEVRTDLSLSGQEGVTSVSVTTDAASSSAVGVYASAGAPDIELRTASVSVSGPSDASSYWCLGVGSSSASPTWELAGATSLSSSTNTQIRQTSAKISFGEGFSLEQEKLYVSTLSSELAEFASVDSSIDATALAARVEPVTGSVFEGYDVQVGTADSSTVLTWSKAAVVRNAMTQKTYATLSAALADASSGDALVLDGDLMELSAEAVTKKVTLDLQGHQLVIAAGSAAAGSGAALALSGDGDLKVCDSSEGNAGQLALHIGAEGENASRTYQGVSLPAGTALSLDDVRAAIAYTGTSNSLPLVSLRGVALAGGTFAMSGSSTLAVSSAPQDGAYGATTVYGLWADATGSSSVDISSASSVTVTNNSEQLSHGVADYPDSTTENSTTTVNLIELDLDEGSDLYKEIQDAFLKNAKLDSSSDTQGKVFNDNVYYASDLELSSGLTVWAYSDSVAASEIGKLASIKPTHIFIRAPYDDENDAYGIYASDDFAGKMTVQGSLSTSTGEGNAIGVYRASSKAVWDVDESKISASAATGTPYFKRASSKMDLADYLHMGGFDVTGVSYPKDSSYYAVALMTPEAHPILSSTEELGTGSPSLDESNYKQALYPQMSNDAVSVTFQNIRDASGTIQQSVTQSVAYGKTLKEQGNAEVVPADYESGGVTYRFVGWKVSGESTVYVRDPDTLYASTAIDSNLQGVVSGAVTLSAAYVPVGSGQSLVSFAVDGRVVAYAVDTGAKASFGDCYNSSGALAPSKLDTETGYTYTFAGWTSAMTGDAAYANPPRVTGDVTYTATFSRTLTPLTLSTAYRSTSESGSSPVVKTVSVDDWTHPITSILDGYDTVGSVRKSTGTVYTFKGWSPRMSDVEPLYTSGDVLVAPSTSSFGTRSYLFGVYEKTDQLIKVNVYSGGSLVASSDAVAANTTIANALSALGVSSAKLAAPSTDQEFRGWYTSADADKILTTSLTTVGSACGYGDELDLYSIWRTKRYLVTLYDSDKKTVVGRYYVNKGETLEQSNADFELTLTGEKKDTFEGWEDENGKSFSTADTVVTRDMSVYAVYETRKKGTSKTTKGTTGAKMSKTHSPAGGISASGGLSASGARALDSASGLSSNPPKASKETPTAASGADSSEANQDQTSSGDMGADGTLLSRVILGIAAGVAVLALVLFAIWFIRRRRNDAEPAVAQAMRERIHF